MLQYRCAHTVQGAEGRGGSARTGRQAGREGEKEGLQGVTHLHRLDQSGSLQCLYLGLQTLGGVVSRHLARHLTTSQDIEQEQEQRQRQRQ